MITSTHYFDIEPVNLTPLVAYQLFYSIKVHFNNEQYSYVRYELNEKSFNEKNFLENPDKHIYRKLADKLLYQNRYIPLVVSNIYHNPKIWVGDLLQKDCIDRAVKYRKYMNTFYDAFISDITNLFLTSQIQSVSDLYSLDNTKNYFGQIAKGKINPLTGAILNTWYYEKHLSNTIYSIVYKRKNFELTRLSDFISKDKMSILSDSILYELEDTYRHS